MTNPHLATINPTLTIKEARQALVDIIALFDTENPAANGDFTPQNAMDNDTLLLQEALGAIAAERFRQANSLLGP